MPHSVFHSSTLPKLALYFAFAVGIQTAANDVVAQVLEPFSPRAFWRSSTATFPTPIALGDVDLDGGLDLLLGDLAENLLLSSEATFFSVDATWFTNEARNTAAIAIGDVNGDGYLDLVCGNSTAADGIVNTLYLNDGGTLQGTPTWRSREPNSTIAVALGDVDGDGDLDLVCGNSTIVLGEPNTLYRNVGGDSIFTPTPVWRSDIDIEQTTCLALGDMDGDGDLDLVCGNSQQPNTIYLNVGGDSVFVVRPRWQSGPQRAAFATALGDIDGDGDLDAVFGNISRLNPLQPNPVAQSRNTAYLNVGGDSILTTAPIWISAGEFETFGTHLGDIDGDGDLDLACANDGVNTLYINNGGVLDTVPDWRSTDSRSAYAGALNDVDADGDLDFIVGNRSAPATVFRNQTASFPDTATAIAGERFSWSVALVDVDNDSDLDLISGNGDPDNDGAGEFNTLQINTDNVFSATPCEWQIENDTRSLAYGDVDRDGEVEIAFGNFDGQNTIQSATCALVQLWASRPANMTTSLVLRDVDGDNDLDLLCGNSGQSNTLYVNSSGVIDSLPTWSSGRANITNSLAVGDVDGNGTIDLVCGNAGQNTLYLNFLSETVLDTTPTTWSLEANVTRSVDLGDVDGDGDLDLVCGNAGFNALYENTGGAKVFDVTPKWLSNAPNTTNVIVFEDVDLDGDLDVVCGNQGPLTVYTNEGGVLEREPAQLSSTINTTQSLVFGDVDGDGDMDLVTGNNGFQGEANLFFQAIKAPAFKGDPNVPTNHLPNNSAFLQKVTVTQINANLYTVDFIAVDVESDRTWIVAEYQFEGGTWQPVELVGMGTENPFVTSPSGKTHSLEWDVTLVPFDPREVVLRLRPISNFQRVGQIRQNAPYHVKVGNVVPSRPELMTSLSRITFPTIDNGGSATEVLTLHNSGTDPLTITDIEVDANLNVRVDVTPPVTLLTKQNLRVNVSLLPSSSGVLSGTLNITSTDPVQPVRSITVSGRVRALDFFLPTLRETGVDNPVTISVGMADSVRVDSARVVYWDGGDDPNSETNSIRLTRIDDAVREEFTGVIPATSVTSRGLEYRVSVHNGTVETPSDIRRVRTRTQSLSLLTGTFANRYQMMSLPIELTGGLIIGVVEDDLGGRDETEWRMFAYTGGTPQYLEVPTSEVDTTVFTNFTPGKAVWLITRSSRVIDTAPDPGLSNPTDSAFVLPLHEGWNMIANPFTFPVAWDSVVVDTFSMATARSLMMVGPPYRWLPAENRYSDVMANSTEAVRTLGPFEGYFVEADTHRVLRIPPVEAPPTLKGKTIRVAKPTTDNWQLQIKAFSEGAADISNYVGVRPDGRAGRDRHDITEPPPSPGNSMSLYFPPGNWSRQSRYYTVDIRGKYQPVAAADRIMAMVDSDLWGHVWRFDIATNYSTHGPGDEVALEFVGVEDAPDEAVMLIVDRRLHQLVDIRTTRRYSFYAARKERITEASAARFMLLVGSEAFVDIHDSQLPELPTKTALHQNYPNPFNPSTLIRYDIARTGNVDLRIYDVSGALVKVLEAGSQPRGRYEVLWRGHNERGTQVASGVYFYRLRADHTSWTRKMIVIK